MKRKLENLKKEELKLDYTEKENLMLDREHNITKQTKIRFNEFHSVRGFSFIFKIKPGRSMICLFSVFFKCMVTMKKRETGSL